MDIQIPWKYSPRSYQQTFLQAMKHKRRAVLVWHRRAGKDKTTLNFTILKMLERKGLYYYFFPTYAQGKKILWDGLGRDGFRFMEHFPGWLNPGARDSLVSQVWQDDMKIELSNGSIFQIIGTDKMDSIVGTNPVGCIFSEYSLQNPKAYDLVRPILRENQGWAVFVYTPRGKNHGHRLYMRVKDNPDWYSSMLTVDMTRRDAPGEDNSQVVTPSDIDDDRKEGMSEALIQQEYFCDFEGAIEGAYYADAIARMKKENRLILTPHDPALLVDTAWDLGIDDSTAIIFTQTAIGGQVLRVVDYYENNGYGLEHYVKYLREKDYAYGIDYMPHDLKVREWGTGKTRYQQAVSLGLHPVVVTKLSVEDGIQAVRRLLPRVYMDPDRCARLHDAVVSYHREFDEKLQVWGKPVHDWSSHAADALRYRAIAWQEMPQGRRPTRADTWFHPWDSNRQSAYPEKADVDFDPRQEVHSEMTDTRSRAGGTLHG